MKKIEYDEMSLEELQAILKSRKIKALQDLDEENVKEPKSKLNVSIGLKKDVDTSDNIWRDLAIEFGATKSYEQIFNYSSDAGCEADLAVWTPSEYFPNIILHAVADNCDLLGACKIKVDVKAGNGSNVEFRFIDARTAQGNLSACTCMDCSANAFTSIGVSVGRFGDYAVVCEKDNWETADYKRETLKAMSLGATRYVNSEILDAIAEATEGVTSTSRSELTGVAGIEGSCCTDTEMLDLFFAISDAITDLQDADYEPDVIVMSSEVAGIFRFASSIEIPVIVAGSVKYDDKGKLVGLLGMKVILTSLMPAIAQGVDLAYIIQSDRSIAVAWGRQPNFTQVYDGVCDSWKLTYNAYMGVDSLDDASIAHVANA